MHTKIFSATTIGINAHLVDVEVDLSFGLVQFYIVGLPDAAIRESNKRILSALKNSGFRLPAKKITVNLAPADLKKEGTLFDLPIALGILLAAELIELDKKFLQETLFLGELSLDGTIRFIRGALPIACDAHAFGFKRIILPKDNSVEVSLISTVQIIGVSSLTELVAYLRGEQVIAPLASDWQTYAAQKADPEMLDFSQVRGNQQAKRALQIAAAGRHNIMFMGSPGSGKTMLAKRLPTIMPPLTFQEVLQITKVYSVSGKLGNSSLVVQRPFRNPHHTISQAGLIGGGSYPQPGEISLAHHGILFLDELTEFKRDTLEALRQPLENRHVHIARVHQSVEFPASFLFVAALNPCPCGFLGDKKRACVCSPQQISKYLAKLSGPLVDRIDIQVYVQSLEYEEIKDPTVTNISSEQMRTAVHNALAMQEARFGVPGRYNSTMTSTEIEQHCITTPAAEVLIKKAFDKLHLSMRGYHKILKTARTIADLVKAEIIDVAHIHEAIMYRSLDQHLEQK